MQTGQRRETDFMKTDEAGVDTQNTKTKRQIDCVALSSGGGGVSSDSNRQDR